MSIYSQYWSLSLIRYPAIKFFNVTQMKRKKKLSIEDLVFTRLRELNHPVHAGQIIRFPIVFAKICPILCLTKDQAWLVLKELQNSGKIEIVPYQGLRIKKMSIDYER
jgi:hypothetical protein